MLAIDVWMIVAEFPDLTMRMLIHDPETVTNQKPVLVQWTNQRADWRWPGLRTLLRDMLRLLEAAKLSQNYTPVS